MFKLYMLQAMYFNGCHNLQLSGLTHLDSPQIHIFINSCNNVSISKLTITAPGDSLNTDGIDIAHSNNVSIVDSVIGTGN